MNFGSFLAPPPEEGAPLVFRKLAADWKETPGPSLPAAAARAAAALPAAFEAVAYPESAFLFFPPLEPSPLVALGFAAFLALPAATCGRVRLGQSMFRCWQAGVLRLPWLEE